MLGLPPWLQIPEYENGAAPDFRSGPAKRREGS